MIGVEEGDANRESRSEFDFRRCIQWNWSLLESEMTFHLLKGDELTKSL